MRIASLHTYPIKGSHRNDHDEAVVERQGLAGDRRWIVVDPDGVGITQRETPLLSQLTVTPVDGGLVIRTPRMPDLHVAEPVDGPKEFVRVFRHQDAVPIRRDYIGAAEAKLAARERERSRSATEIPLRAPEFSLG